jgi:hypothetical protein
MGVLGILVDDQSGDSGWKNVASEERLLLKRSSVGTKVGSLDVASSILVDGDRLRARHLPQNQGSSSLPSAVMLLMPIH